MGGGVCVCVRAHACTQMCWQSGVPKLTGCQALMQVSSLLLVAQTVKNLPSMQFNPWVGKIPWRRACLSTPVSLPGEFQDRGAWQSMGSQRVDDQGTNTSLIPTTLPSEYVFPKHKFSKMHISY